MEYVEMDPPVWYQDPMADHSLFLVVGTRYANWKTQWVVIVESASGLAVDEIDREWLHQCQQIRTEDVPVNIRQKLAVFLQVSQKVQ